MNEPAEPLADGPLFEEVQRFRQPWIILLLLGISLFTIGIFIVGMYQQFVLGEPWGDQPMLDTGLILFSSVIIAVVLLVNLIVFGMTLTVRVQGSGLYIRYWPFIRRFIPWDQIDSYKSITYNPMLDYGGWGIKGFGKRMAYNVSGNRGLQLELNNGRHLLLGSQSPERLEQAIRMACGE